ncbi:hypothetical protein QBC40DRAFT_176707 [Triangularia verruculosa]|uniref:Uncharacterized protein n=1 Tax=Triangularia verruculosa TaxID=2587418 RepID=A0AAN6XEM8_9PEZI|nr:hypothetical protein QBC40DRAFT_176707 [Triangularia verruculosa]
MADHQLEAPRREPTQREDADILNPSQEQASLDHLAAIQKLLVAIAKHVSVPIPRELLPVKQAGPQKGHYDSRWTIDYQLRQLPTQWDFLSGIWRDLFIHFSLPEPAVVRHDLAGATGLAKALSWKIDKDASQNGAYVNYEEFGYDEDGYLSQVEPVEPHTETAHSTRGSAVRVPSHESNRHQSDQRYVPPTEITEHISQPSSPPWAGQYFGREWKFGLNGIRDDTMLSIAALKLCYDSDLDKDGENSALAFSRKRLAEYFLTQFKGNWDLSRHLWGVSDHRRTSSSTVNTSRRDDLVFQYHMRIMTTVDWLRGRGDTFKRSSGTLFDDNGARCADIVEVRYSVGLKTTWRLDFPVFSLITLADSISVDGLKKIASLQDKDMWEAAGIHPSIRATGVAAFTFRIQSLIPLWESQWLSLLDHISQVLSSDILRIAADWMQESMDDLGGIVSDMERLYFSSKGDNMEFATFLPSTPDARDSAMETFRQNWEVVISHQQKIGTALISRINKKQEELKSFSDTLFNAASIQEATRATQLNHYILVFTIITIFYLPLSFVTVYPRQGIRFGITMALLAVVTYFSSWLLIWIVTNPARRDGIKNAFAEIGRMIFSN